MYCLVTAFTRRVASRNDLRMQNITHLKSRGVNHLRKGWVSIPGQIYHVTAVTNGKAPVFRQLSTGRILVSCLKFESDQRRATSLAFVVMPDHLHWLLQLSNDAALSGVVQNVKANSGRLINSESRSTGPIWQRGFYDRAIRRDEDLPAIARYIVANPLRAGIARSCGDYPLWDSIWV